MTEIIEENVTTGRRLRRFGEKLLKPFIPNNLVLEEISGIYGNILLREFGQIIEYYNIYNFGAEFMVKADDFVPSQLHFRKIKSMIDKEARFMFSKCPDVSLNAIDATEENIKKVDVYQKYINEVLKQNNFESAIIKAAKDCFIGKRVALICNFDEEHGITLSFIPSLEFTFETDAYGVLTKFIAFYSLNDLKGYENQRFHKKKYWIENKICYFEEGIYDGGGNLVEKLIDKTATKFSYIPAVVIVNDGLSGDNLGESEVELLVEYEEMYSKLANLDIDAERQNMNPIRWVRDIDSDSTKDLSIAPGAFWDLKTDTTVYDATAGTIGVLESNLNYSAPMNTTLQRIRDAMYELIDMPAVSTSELQGVISTGKTLKALYWGLIVRCDEKFMTWKPQLEKIIRCVIDGYFMYPEIAKRYLPEGNDVLEKVALEIQVINQYSLPEDEESEKTIDLAEVSNQTMSKKAYMKKWRNLTEDEADAELRQIAYERQILEESYLNTQTFDNMNDETFGIDVEKPSTTISTPKTATAKETVSSTQTVEIGNLTGGLNG